MPTKGWFEVDRDGLKQLMDGKPKHWIVRELVSNCFDEEITQCIVKVEWGMDHAGWATIIVQDDAPQGFKRISDAFTLFGDTEKRSNPDVRGRFNMGDKMVIALAGFAEIVTTKGTVTFNGEGRRESRARKRFAGSLITLVVRMTSDEAAEMIQQAKQYIVPSGVSYVVNGTVIPFRQPEHLIELTLPTVLQIDNAMRPTARKTAVTLYRAWLRPGILYEMGIPVQSIECPWDVNVQQKVPLGVDRDVVSDAYLAKIYAGVLNEVHETIEPGLSADTWVHTAMEHPTIQADAVRHVIKARFGEKAVVARPGEDLEAVSDAISDGYKVVYGPQMSAAEWENVRKATALPTASSLFPHGTVAGEWVSPTPGMLEVKALVERIAAVCFEDRQRISIDVAFKRWPGGVNAQYSRTPFRSSDCPENRGTVTFNVKNLGEAWFDHGPTAAQIDLVTHELCHEFGTHTDRAYLDAITRLTGLLVMKVLIDPEFLRRLDA